MPLTRCKRPLWGASFILSERQKATKEREALEADSIPRPEVLDEHTAQSQRDSDLWTVVQYGRESDAVSYLKTMEGAWFSNDCLQNCLLIAARRGSRALVEGLLVNKADIDYGFFEGSPRSALATAISRGHVGVASLLLANGAEVNRWHRSTTDTMLMCAVGSPNSVEMVKLLLSWGAVVNVLNAEGQSALVLAIMAQNPAVVTMLVEHGAKIDGPLWEEATPLELAEGFGMADAVTAGLQLQATLPSPPPQVPRSYVGDIPYNTSMVYHHDVVH